MNTKIIFSLVIILVFSGSAFAQNWRELKTVEDVCDAYPEKMKSMLNQFDLEYPGLDKVKKAYDSGKLTEACEYLLYYYRKGNTAEYLRKELPEKTNKTEARADTILKNVFVVQNVSGKVPWGDDGHRDWYYKGPNNDREWAWLSNRHSQLRHVFNVYIETGNPKYAIYIDEFLRDFIIKSMPYPAQKSGESIWRGLEVAARAKVWSRIFYGMLNSEYLSPATRLLMLSSLPDHAHYNRNFHGGNNWLTMEISALATVAANWPELKKSQEWLNYAVETISESMKGQVYPDGVQTELTSHYHNVAMRNFVLFKDICDTANYQLPGFFDETIEKMYSYIAHVVRPDGYRILNNDGDRGSDVELILEGAEKYNYPEWEYIATNGEKGVEPADGPSYFYPWAGHLVSRSGFDENAQWSFFDVGPWGSGHQHNDRLHLSIAAYGKDLLVDAGRFAYTGEVARKFRGYAKGTQGHNTIMIDGKGQMPGVRVAEKPLTENHFKITSEYDYAWNSFDQYYDLKNIKHTRSLMYVRGEFWVVVDKIETRQPRNIETLWHWHPDCKIETDDSGIISTINKKGNLKVMPVEKINWEVKVIEGREEPEIQGWYSEEYNKFEPNKAVIHSTRIDGDETFVWLLLPSEKKAPKTSAEIISENESGIQVKVTNREKATWNLTIPFSDSNKTKFDFTQ